MYNFQMEEQIRFGADKDQAFIFCTDRKLKKKHLISARQTTYTVLNYYYLKTGYCPIFETL